MSGTGGASGTTTEVKAEQTDSEIGLPGSTSLSLGALLGEQFDLGTRFNYSSHTTKYGSSGPTYELSAFEIEPYFAYVPGSRQDSLRVAFGLTAGYGAGSIKVTTQGTGGTTSTSTTTDNSADTKGYGAFIGLKGFVSDMASIDPTIMFMSTSASSGGIDLSGYTVMLNVGLSLWTGGGEPKSAARPHHKASREGSESSNGQSDSDGGASVVAKPKSGTVTLNFGSERTIMFVHSKGPEPSIIILVRDPAPDNILSSCEQLTLHAVNQKDALVEAAAGTAASQGIRFPVLKAAISIETLRPMAVAPIASNAAMPEHWIDVCNQRWKISEAERSHLKEFVEGLPAAGAAPSSQLAPPSSSVPAETAPVDPSATH